MLVLIVEDNPGDALLIEKALVEVGGPGTQVVVLETGEAAVEHLGPLSGDDVPDLLLVDLNLPKMSGLQFLEWVREQDALKGRPVAVISAFHNLDAELARKLGASAYFKKPDDVGGYVKILRRTLDARPEGAGE